MKTLYIWDLAGALFLETWNRKKSGKKNYYEYLKSLGFDLKKISPYDYEWFYRTPYLNGWLKVAPALGFKKVLAWTKNNVVFTTGIKEQINWRAEQLLPKYHFDVRKHIKKIYTTFDYKNTNVKTKEMLQNVIKRNYKKDYKRFVYIDDKKKNCFLFITAFKTMLDKGFGLNAVVYHIKNDGSGIKSKSDKFIEVGSLSDVLISEKVIS